MDTRWREKITTQQSLHLGGWVVVIVMYLPVTKLVCLQRNPTVVWEPQNYLRDLTGRRQAQLLEVIQAGELWESCIQAIIPPEILHPPDVLREEYGTRGGRRESATPVVVLRPKHKLGIEGHHRHELKPRTPVKNVVDL
uniref:Uncharacterized protein n=1 Tax=Coccidioides posadasii RMSCC 3488 TaxID=454284 RepID=A0A0J6FMX1_COCPO|nr:hypothetical protein CPAG_06561 [Coccidioides posadasii RMSCC 3488]